MPAVNSVLVVGGGAAGTATAILLAEAGVADGAATPAIGDRRARYDLVVGADGIRSWTRRMLGVQLETRAVGMGIWRAFGPRPASVTRTDLYYGGPWDDIRETLDDPSRVNYTWFETHVLDAPWNRGRVVLIGDAAHSCPPTVAQGGAMALEDAVVLAELLTERETLDQDLWDAFHARRFDRAKTVVDASNQLAQWQLEHVQGDVPGLMRSIAALTSQPA